MTDISSVTDCQAALDYHNPRPTGSDGANCATGYNCVVEGNGRKAHELRLELLVTGAQKRNASVLIKYERFSPVFKVLSVRRLRRVVRGLR